jgi:hypothetical protein
VQGLVSRAQRSESGALQNRDLQKFGACDDPGSAVQHFVLHCIRETWRAMTPAQ